MIRLADSSDLDWGLVILYEANPLPDDSDDECGMLQAETRANLKLRRRRKKVHTSIIIRNQAASLRSFSDVNGNVNCTVDTAQTKVMFHG
jgi:hypothetical protein